MLFVFLRMKLIWDHSSLPIEAFSAINFLLSTVLVVCSKFGYIAFSYSFSSKYFIISLLIFPLTHRLFRLCSFQICGAFPEILLLLISNKISLYIVREHTWYYLNLSKFTEIAFMSQDMVFLSKSSMCILLLAGMCCKSIR